MGSELDWFEQLTGLVSDSKEQVWAGMALEGEWLHLLAKNTRLRAGRLSVPMLGKLGYGKDGGRIRFSEVVADVKKLHADPANAGAVFQVASQTNLLEMVGPEVAPEEGIIRYAYDLTQGPACAMACAAGLIYRSYFVPLGGQCGQSQSVQIDTLADLGNALGNFADALWQTRNGYVLPKSVGALRLIEQQLVQHPAHYRTLVRVGVQEHTQVTLPGCEHTVTQVYASALPIAYCRFEDYEWNAFARLVLEASYEATFLVAAQSDSKRLFLTRLGGGAFGNPDAWINEAILNAARRVPDVDLDVVLVSHGQTNCHNQHIIDTWQNQQTTPVVSTGVL